MSMKRRASPKSNRKAPALLPLCPGYEGGGEAEVLMLCFEKQEGPGLPHLLLNVPSAGDPTAQSMPCPHPALLRGAAASVPFLSHCTEPGSTPGQAPLLAGSPIPQHRPSLRALGPTSTALRGPSSARHKAEGTALTVRRAHLSRESYAGNFNLIRYR